MLDHKYIDDESLEVALQSRAEADRIHWLSLNGYEPHVHNDITAASYRAKWIDHNRYFFVHFLDEYLHEVSMKATRSKVQDGK